MPRKEVSAVHLLREHIPAEGDAALQGDCGEVRTLSAFRFRPGPHGRNNPSKRGPQEIQEAEIGSDRLDAVAVFRALRTELQKLHHALEIITGSDPLDARNVLDLGREARIFRNTPKGISPRNGKKATEKGCQVSEESAVAVIEVLQGEIPRSQAEIYASR